MTARFMVDDCGTLIDMTNGNNYDYVSDVCELLNELHEENDKLKNNVDSWVQTAKFYLQKVYELRTSVSNIKKEYENLKKENEELKSIKRFAEKHGINIFKIDEAFQKCWNDNGKLIKENNELKKEGNSLVKLLENQSIIIQELHLELMNYQLKEPIVLTKEDLEIMGKAISYYTHGGFGE